MKTTDTAVQLLETAQDLVQSRGYHGFNLDELAEISGVSSAEVHRQFETKAAMGVALMGVYNDALDAALVELDGKDATHHEKLAFYINLYRQTEQKMAICACGSLASDYTTLAGGLQECIRAYFKKTECWISETLQAGLDDNEFTLAGEVDEVATDLLAALQGGLILSRARSGLSVIDSVESIFMSRLLPIPANN